MIKINKINDITFVSASVTDFSDSLGYCEYKVPLSIKGVKPRPNQARSRKYRCKINNSNSHCT